MCRNIKASRTNTMHRISATDRLETVFPDQPSWTVKDSARLAHLLAEHGVDVLDVSSAGNHPQQALPPKGLEAFHADLSAAIKASVGDKLIVTTVGGITNGKTAQAVLDKGEADVIFVGRQFQKEPGTVWKFAEDLGVSITVANQIGWGFFGRGIVKARSEL
jgi:2,4-dienoyl-CoA reductase-like NADH-dependent reductase (Old Yellow Enzyme family)